MADSARTMEQVARRYCQRCGRTVLASRRVPEGAALDPFVVLGTLGLALLFRKIGLDAKLEPFRCPSCGEALSGRPAPAPGNAAPAPGPVRGIRSAQEYVQNLARVTGSPAVQDAAYRKGIRDGILYHYGPAVTRHVDRLIAAGNAARAVKLLNAARPYRRPRARRLVKLLLAPVLIDLTGLGVLIGGAVYTAHSARSVHWPTAEGRVVWSGIDTSQGDNGPSYRAEVRYAYTVNGISYKGSRVSFNPFSGAWERAASTVARYAPGTAVPVRYDPAKPSRSVLEPGVTGAGVVFILVGLSLLVSSGVTLVFLVRKPLAEMRALEQRLRST